MKAAASSGQRERLVIVGNGMVGHHCVEQLVSRGALQRFEVRVFGEERQRAYDRVHLSEYFGGSCAETLALCERDFYSTSGVHLHLGEAVLEIDRERCEVVTAEGRYGYDHLVLATGSYPFVPPIEGCSGSARLVYRTLDDLDGIRAAAAEARRGVVVGGGLLGLEAANALKSLGLGLRRLGLFTSIVLFDQRVSMWTSLLGLTVAVIASLKFGLAFLLVYLLWIGITRLILTIMLLCSGHNVGPAYPLILYYNQIIGALMKIYVFFRLDKQSWTRQPTALKRDLASFQQWFNTWSSRTMTFSAASIFVAVLFMVV